MNKEEFVNSVKNLNISINEDKLKKLDIYFYQDRLDS